MVGEASCSPAPGAGPGVLGPDRPLGCPAWAWSYRGHRETIIFSAVVVFRRLQSLIAQQFIDSSMEKVLVMLCE